MTKDLTQGGITKTLVLFSLPMIAGNLLQQLYNIADTLIVGRFLGANALAAVGSAYTLMTFLTSILLGLAMGSGALVSICWGQRDGERMRSCVAASFTLIGVLAALLTVGVYLLVDPILALLQVPEQVWDLMRVYLLVIFAGIPATFLYNYFACMLRAVGNSAVPLAFLGVSSVMNIGLDLLFVRRFDWGVAGAAFATVLSQYLSGIGLAVYSLFGARELLPHKQHWRFGRARLAEVASYSLLTCMQQSIMNFGILMVQGRVNSFGPAVMSAFAAAVKIDTFAYMPAQDLGNAFSTFVAQNYGAGKADRIQKGIRRAVAISAGFCVAVSALVFVFAHPLMLIFVAPEETEILAIGVQYLRIEGSFYCGIGCLFLLYGLYRAMEKPGMSVVLTILSLGTRVILAYGLSAIPAIGVTGIWWSVPIGWFLADLVGFVYYWKNRARLQAVLTGSAKGETT